MTESVRDVMHHGILSCRPTDSVQHIAQQMTEHDVSALVVVDNRGYLAGVVSQTDLVRARTLEQYWRLRKGLDAEHLMTRDVVTISPEASLVDASRVMVEKHIHRLVVVEREGDKQRPVGILSVTDVVRDMARDE